jgi:superfamily I DNA and/or RNA helicase
MLRENYRNPPGIVAAINDLSYGGRLVSMRSRSSEHPMQFIPVIGQDQVIGSSRVNSGEVEVLLAWLRANGPRLKEAYRESRLDEILAIISPFRLQCVNIKAKLVEMDMAGIRCGTVHTIQGQQKPVVLFSSVVTHPDYGQMLNRKPNLLNVAASRSMEQFIVFGHPSLWPTQNFKDPSSIIARHLTTLIVNHDSSVSAGMGGKLPSNMGPGG